MAENSLQKLAWNILHYSLQVKAGERAFIYASPLAKPLLLVLTDEIKKIGAYPYFTIFEEALDRAFLNTLPVDKPEEVVELINKRIGPENYIIDHADVSIIIRSKESDNPYEGVPMEILGSWQKVMGAIFSRFTRETRWVVMDWPTENQARKAGMTYNEFYEYVMRVSAIDYSELNRKAQPLKQILDVTDKVRISGPGTDLSFSKKGINTIIGTAENSYIDGEVYTAPIKDSVEGYVSYSVPTIYMGQSFDGIRLKFSKGRIVKATCKKGSQKALDQIIDTDEGSRYIGEFALGINPEVNIPMNDIHYDEKIAMSFHLTPGQCYDEAPNGNNSAVHWDLVCMQSKEYGGGEIWLDDVLIRKDGLFVHPDLIPLNPGFSSSGK